MLRVVVKLFYKTVLDIFENKTSKTICIELTISKGHWCIFFIYKPPKIRKSSFFEGMSNTLSQTVTVNKCENIFIAGDVSIDISNVTDENTSYFSDLWDTSKLKNFVAKSKCYKSVNGSIIDLQICQEVFERTLFVKQDYLTSTNLFLSY